LYWVGLCASLPQAINNANSNKKAATATPGG